MHCLSTIHYFKWHDNLAQHIPYKFAKPISNKGLYSIYLWTTSIMQNVTFQEQKQYMQKEEENETKDANIKTFQTWLNSKTFCST